MSSRQELQNGETIMGFQLGFNWGAEFDKCENEHDLRDTGRAAAQRIQALESQMSYYRNQLVQIHELVSVASAV
jgi:hypothetical protein